MNVLLLSRLPWIFENCRTMKERKHDKWQNLNAIVNHKWSKYCDRLLWACALAHALTLQMDVKRERKKRMKLNTMSSWDAREHTNSRANEKTQTTSSSSSPSSSSSSSSPSSSSNSMIELTWKLDKSKNRDENHVMR